MSICAQYFYSIIWIWIKWTVTMWQYVIVILSVFVIWCLEHTSRLCCTSSFSLARRWLRSHSAPLVRDPGSGGRSSPLSRPAGSARGSHRRRTATGTSAGSGSRPGSAAARNGQMCAGGHTPGTSLSWFWWFQSSRRPGDSGGVCEWWLFTEECTTA